MSRAKRKHRPKPPQRHPLEEQASPELRSLIKTHNILTIGNWEDARAIKNAHGDESEIVRHVEKVWGQSRRGRTTALEAALSFPSRSYADLAAKLAFARDNREISAYQPAAALVAYLYGDVERLANAAPPESADKELIDRVSECDAAIAVHRTLSERHVAERKEAERAADAAGYRETKDYSAGEAWRARNDFIGRIMPAASYDRWNSAHKEMGRTAKAALAIKAKTLRGAVAKLRLVVKLIGVDDLDTWQGDRDWLAETLADFERLAGPTA